MAVHSLDINLGHVPGEARRAWDCDLVQVIWTDGTRQDMTLVDRQRGSSIFMAQPVDKDRVIRVMAQRIAELEAAQEEEQV